MYAVCFYYILKKKKIRAPRSRVKSLLRRDSTRICVGDKPPVLETSLHDFPSFLYKRIFFLETILLPSSALPTSLPSHKSFPLIVSPLLSSMSSLFSAELSLAQLRDTHLVICQNLSKLDFRKPSHHHPSAMIANKKCEVLYSQSPTLSF